MSCADAVSELRSLFVQLTREGYPLGSVIDDPAIWHAIVGADAAATKAALAAVGAAAIAAGGAHPSLVVARRVLGAKGVREEVAALQQKLVLVGDRQAWALGRKDREEAQRLAKIESAEKREEEKDEKAKDKEDAIARTKNVGPGDVDKQNRDEDDESGSGSGDDAASDSEDDGASDSEKADSENNQAVDEDDWSSGGEDDAGKGALVKFQAPW